MTTPQLTQATLVASLFNPESPNYNPSYLATPQATGSVLGVTEGTLSVWRCTGRYKLPFVKVGRKVCYRVGDVVAFIKNRTFRIE